MTTKNIYLEIVEQLTTIATKLANAAAQALPTVTGADNGKLMGVSSGEWAAVDAPKELPTVSGSDNGKKLGVSGGVWTAVAAELPANPDSNGTYVLTATKTADGCVLSWEAAAES